MCKKCKNKGMNKLVEKKGFKRKERKFVRNIVAYITASCERGGAY